MLLFLFFFLLTLLTNSILQMEKALGAAGFQSALWDYITPCLLPSLLASVMMYVFYRIVLFWLKKTNNCTLYIQLHRVLYTGTILGICAFLMKEAICSYSKVWCPAEYSEELIWQEGFGDVEDERIWMIGDESVLALPVGEALRHSDMSVEMDIVIHGACQKIKILMNQTVLFDNVLQEGGKITFLLPQDENSGDIVNLYFEHPDAVSPKQLGQGEDERRLAVCVYKISVENM